MPHSSKRQNDPPVVTASTNSCAPAPGHMSDFQRYATISFSAIHWKPWSPARACPRATCAKASPLATKKRRERFHEESLYRPAVMQKAKRCSDSFDSFAREVVMLWKTHVLLRFMSSRFFEPPNDPCFATCSTCQSCAPGWAVQSCPPGWAVQGQW